MVTTHWIDKKTEQPNEVLLHILTPVPDKEIVEHLGNDLYMFFIEKSSDPTKLFANFGLLVFDIEADATGAGSTF